MHFLVLLIQFLNSVSVSPSLDADNTVSYTASHCPSTCRNLTSFCRAWAHLPCRTTSCVSLSHNCHGGGSTRHVLTISEHSVFITEVCSTGQTRADAAAVLMNLGTSYFPFVFISVAHHGIEGRLGEWNQLFHMPQFWNLVWKNSTTQGS